MIKMAKIKPDYTIKKTKIFIMHRHIDFVFSLYFVSHTITAATLRRKNEATVDGKSKIDDGWKRVHK